LRNPNIRSARIAEPTAESSISDPIMNSAPFGQKQNQVDGFLESTAPREDIRATRLLMLDDATGDGEPEGDDEDITSASGRSDGTMTLKTVSFMISQNLVQVLMINKNNNNIFIYLSKLVHLLSVFI
jgi:hypothetical protein